MIRKIVLAAAFCLICASPVLAAGKIGVADFVALREQTQMGQEAQRQAQALFARDNASLEADFNAFQQKVAEFQRQQAALSERAKNERSQELQKLSADLESRRASLNQRVAAFDQAVTPQMTSVLNVALADYAKKNNFDIILDGAGVAYAVDAMNLTVPLIKALDDAWKAQGGAFNLAGVQ
jgi:outer membrane protein